MYLHYDTQSSHEGYIDMEFKEIKDYPQNEYSYSLGEDELFEAICEGWWYEGEAPKYITRVMDFEGDYRAAQVSKRRIKRWCYNMANK